MQTDYCTLDTLESFEPQLAQILMEKGETDDGLYSYRLSRRGYVYRMLLEDRRAWALHGRTERARPMSTLEKWTDRKPVSEGVPPS